MKIGIIGYNGHASRHIGILKNVSNAELIIYHPKKDLDQISKKIILLSIVKEF